MTAQPRKAKSERQLSSSASNEASKVDPRQQRRRPSSERALSRRVRLSPQRTGVSASSPGGRGSNRRLNKSASISPATTRPRVAAPMLTEDDVQSPMEMKSSFRRTHRRRASTGTTTEAPPSVDDGHRSHRQNADGTKPGSYSARESHVGSNSSRRFKLSPPRSDSRHHMGSRRASNASSRKYHAAIAGIDMDPFAVRS